MENLNGHEAGNGGHSQGDTYGNSPSLDPTVPSKGHCLLAGESPAMAKSQKPCSLDGRGWWKRCLLKPIDKVRYRRVSEYLGRNSRERRCSLVKDEYHWPSLSIMGEGNILLPTLADREENSGGVAAATRIERSGGNWGNPPRP
jgi:hypothetical protein